jgi:hypothetical protein
MSHRAADGSVVVLPPAGRAVATEEDAHQPPVPPTTHDLPGFSGQTRLLPEKSGTLLAHRRRKLLFQFKDLEERRSEEGISPLCTKGTIMTTIYRKRLASEAGS